MLRLDRATLVVGIMEGYEIDVTKILEMEIHGQAMSMDTILAFPCLLTLICDDERAPVIFTVYQFLMVHRITDLDLIQDYANLISKDKIGATLLQSIFQGSEQMDIYNMGFADLRDTLKQTI